MAIVEFQFRKQAFLDFFKAEINRRRLPDSKLDIFFLPELKGHLLEQIECLSCTADPTAGEGQVTIQAELAIHYHTSLATIRAAGSLNRPVTEQKIVPVPIVISINLSTPKPQLQWQIASGLFPPGIVPIDLPNGLNIQSAAIEASEDAVAIRLGTQPGDPVNAAIVNRLGNSDWCQMVPGQLFADQLSENLSSTLESALSGDLELSKSPSGAWFPFGSFLYGLNTPLAIASAEITAVDQCLFDIDISITLSLIAQFTVSGNRLVTTLVLNWDADSTLCDLVGTLLLTPIGGIAIHVIAEDQASEAILGKAETPDRFQKIGSTDNSITYQSSSILSGPTPSFVLSQAEVNSEGLFMSGIIRNRPLPLGLQGSVSAPASGLKRDCSSRRVTVEFRPAQLYLHDIGMDGPPRVFPDGIIFDPPGAWTAVPSASNDWLDLALTFVDPPGGRLPVGTATSVILDTDCGVRWVDLGVIPPDHEPPTEVDIAAMISECMAISDRWGDGILNLDWLVDPPDLLYGVDPLRQWIIGIQELPEDVAIEFVAVGRDGEERIASTARGSRNIAAQITTRADETLQIRTREGVVAPAPKVFQRWIIPIASLPLDFSPMAVSAAGGMVGVRGSGGGTQVFHIAAGGVLSTDQLIGERQLEPGMERLMRKLTREERKGRESWAVAAQIDRQTVAVVHEQELLIATVGPVTQM